VLGGGIHFAFPLPTVVLLPASPPRTLPRPAVRERYPPGPPSKIIIPMGGTDGTGSPGCGSIGRPRETNKTVGEEKVELSNVNGLARHFLIY